jgi:hypothetical protein
MHQVHVLWLMSRLFKAEVVLYRIGRFYAAKLGTNNLLQCAESHRYVINRWNVPGRSGSILR